jgi:SAM-dependent methyltransferase
MNHNSINAYDADIHVAEIYDQSENRQADVDLILTLLGGVGPLKILEPFCGTGRLLIPLALHGHTVFGMDQSAGMLNRARQKIRELPLGLQQRIDLIRADVLCEEWPVGFDLVILGYNCFYELAVPDEQETCVRQAARCLNPGGYVFIDNDHMEGELAARGKPPRDTVVCCAWPAGSLPPLYEGHMAGWKYCRTGLPAAKASGQPTGSTRLAGKTWLCRGRHVWQLCGSVLYSCRPARNLLGKKKGMTCPH